MGLRCKPGDLAVIIADPTYDDIDVGKMVEVIKFSYHDEDGDVYWECKSVGGLLTGEEPDGTITMREESDICDINLRPIRPDAEPDSVTTTRELAEQ